MSLMNIFKKKPKEDSVSFRTEMAKKIAVHRLRYVTEREGDGILFGFLLENIHE